MAKKKDVGNYQDKYELLIDPTVIITRAPDRQRIDLKKMTMEQADTLYSQPNQRYLRKKTIEKEQNPAEKPGNEEN